MKIKNKQINLKIKNLKFLNERSKIMKRISGQRSLVFLFMFLFIFGLEGAALAASGSLGGSAQPAPDNTSPFIGDSYEVQIVLSNTSFSLESGEIGTPIEAEVVSAALILACVDSECDGTDPGDELPGTVTFVPEGPDGCVDAGTDAACVASCSHDNPDTGAVETDPNWVYFEILPGCIIDPSSTKVLATIDVQQATADAFFMIGQAMFEGTAGACVAGLCDNALDHSCINGAGCNWSTLGGDASGSANITPLAPDIPLVETEVHDPAHTDITGGTVDVGTDVHDKAIVTGSSGTPTGTVDFTLTWPLMVTAKPNLPSSARLRQAVTHTLYTMTVTAALSMNLPTVHASPLMYSR
jgi:hypothetical protein